MIYFAARCQEIITPFLRLNPDGYLFDPQDAMQQRHDERAAKRRTPLSCGNVPGSNRKQKPLRRPHDHYSTGSYLRAITRATDRADTWQKGGRIIHNDERIVERWHPHQLRHNFATMVRREYGPEAALVLLGDRSTRMIDVYAEKDMNKAREVMLKIG